MNSTPRILNRVLVGVLGLLMMAIGALLLLLAGVPAVGRWWRAWSAGAWSNWRDVFARARFPGQQESWLWLVLTVLLAAVIGAMVAWIAQQGKGRASLLAAEEDPGEVPGNVLIGGGVAEQALRAALTDRADVAGAAVATYELRGQPALRVRVQPRQGVAPHLLAADVSVLVEALDAMVGKRTPVLIHISSGARSRFGRSERVR